MTSTHHQRQAYDSVEDAVIDRFIQRGSDAAENTPANLRLWIQNPDAIKPGALMPAMKLSDADLDAVTAYLETLH